MKIYEKPRLIALPVSSSNTLCAGCVIDAVDPNMNEMIKVLLETLEHPFAQDDDCVDPLVGYCKFTSAQNIFDS